jgi:hypothetical protein
MKRLLSLLAVLMLAASSAFAQLGTTAPTATVTVNVAPEAALTIQTAALTLTQAGSNFTDYAGTTNFTYFVRTTKVGGHGTITLSVTTDFSAGGGSTPSVAAPPTATDFLYYTCTVGAANFGTATGCPGTVDSQFNTATNVATFVTDTRSAKAGAASSIIWGLSNDPLYQTGSYTATITFTIAAA